MEQTLAGRHWGPSKHWLATQVATCRAPPGMPTSLNLPCPPSATHQLQAADAAQPPVRATPKVLERMRRTRMWRAMTAAVNHDIHAVGWAGVYCAGGGSWESECSKWRRLAGAFPGRGSPLTADPSLTRISSHARLPTRRL